MRGIEIGGIGISDEEERCGGRGRGHWSRAKEGRQEGEDVGQEGWH